MYLAEKLQQLMALPQHQTLWALQAETQAEIFVAS
jgi:hypothetical protein